MERLFTWDNNQKGGQFVRQILKWCAVETGAGGEEEEEGGNCSLAVFSEGVRGNFERA